MGDHEYDDHDDEIPIHHLPRMSDLQNASGHLSHHSHPKLSDLDNASGQHNHQFHPKMTDLNNPSGHHNYHNPKMSDLENPSGRRQNDPPPPHHHPNGRPLQFSPLPSPAGPPHHHRNDSKPNRRQLQYSPPPPPPYGRRQRSSKAGAFVTLATVLLLLAFTALILYLVYRPKTPHFTVVAASIYLLNTTTPTSLTPYGPAPPPTASFLAASLQFTVVTRNPHRHTSLYYSHLTAQVFYRDQPITPPLDLPPLIHSHRSTVVFSPVLGGGEALPVAPGVVEGLAADEAYGVMALRLVMMGRIRYKAGIIKTAHYGVYVGCDVLVGVKKAVVGPVPLLANHDCKVDM